MFYRVLLILGLILWLNNSAVQAQLRPARTTIADSLNSDSNHNSAPLQFSQMLRYQGVSMSDSIIQYAFRFKGKRYRRGGTGKDRKGFDCSGFTMVVFSKFGYRLPHTSAGQALIGIPVPMKNLTKGDLIFFKGRNRRSRRVGHVGIVISKKGEPVQFIHSASGEGIRTDYLDAEYYRKRFVKGSRVLLQR